MPQLPRHHRGKQAVYGRLVSNAVGLVMRGLWFVAALAMSGGISAQAPAVPVSVTAELHTGGNRTELRFVVSSESSEQIKFVQDALPWGSYGSAAVVVTTPTGEPLGHDAPIDDPGSTIAILAPHQELRGSIDLADRFPSLLKRRRETDLLVFWSYQFRRTMPQGVASRAGGWFLLPRVR